MGIQKLHKWIRTVLPDYRVSWESLRGTRIGVDALGFLYKANEDHVSDCLVIAKLIAFWRSREIEPIFVFDGRVPKEKMATCQRRRIHKEYLPADKQVYVTSDDRNRIKQLLYASGVLFLNATGEADTVLALMMRNGDISAIASQDMDFLARGCETLLVPTSNIEEWKEIRLSNLLDKSNMSYDQFVNMCVLFGSDYCPSVPSLSLTAIASHVKQHPLEAILAKEGIRNPTLWKRSVEILKGISDTWESVLTEKQREKWDTPCNVEQDVLDTLYVGELSPLSHTDRLMLYRCVIP
jgi:5'-3' exonuclease